MAIVEEVGGNRGIQKSANVGIPRARLGSICSRVKNVRGNSVLKGKCNSEGGGWKPRPTYLVVIPLLIISAYFQNREL